jgi:homoserine O-acetyltransferase
VPEGSGGRPAAAFGVVTARTLVPSASSDLYFMPADCATEAAMILGAAYRDLETIWGHMWGSGQSAADTEAVDAALLELLERGP